MPQSRKPAATAMSSAHSATVDGDERCSRTPARKCSVAARMKRRHYGRRLRHASIERETAAISHTHETTEEIRVRSGPCGQRVAAFGTLLDHHPRHMATRRLERRDPQVSVAFVDEV